MYCKSTHLEKRECTVFFFEKIACAASDSESLIYVLRQRHRCIITRLCWSVSILWVHIIQMTSGNIH